MCYYFCGEILIFSLLFITLCLTKCPLCWHYAQCSDCGKICWYNVSNPRAVGASYSIDSLEAFPSGTYIQKTNIQWESIRKELLLRVRLAMITSFWRFPILEGSPYLFTPQIRVHLQTRASCLSRFFNMESSLDLCIGTNWSLFLHFVYCKACAFFLWISSFSYNTVKFQK